MSQVEKGIRPGLVLERVTIPRVGEIWRILLEDIKDFPKYKRRTHETGCQKRNGPVRGKG